MNEIGKLVEHINSSTIKDYQEIKIAGYGNCLSRSIASAIGKEEKLLELRAAISQLVAASDLDHLDYNELGVGLKGEYSEKIAQTRSTLGTWRCR